MNEKDKQSSSKEIRLLRQLLRTDDASEREKLFEDAFTPKDVLIVRTYCRMHPILRLSSFLTHSAFCPCLPDSLIKNPIFVDSRLS